METSGLDPKIMICKITVLPIKLCPLYNYISEERFERSRHVCQQSLNLHCLPIPAFGLFSYCLLLHNEAISNKYNLLIYL